MAIVTRLCDLVVSLSACLILLGQVRPRQKWHVGNKKLTPKSTAVPNHKHQLCFLPPVVRNVWQDEGQQRRPVALYVLPSFVIIGFGGGRLLRLLVERLELRPDVHEARLGVVVVVHSDGRADPVLHGVREGGEGALGVAHHTDGAARVQHQNLMGDSALEKGYGGTF